MWRFIPAFGELLARVGYLRLQKGAEAAAEFQKIVDHKGANWALPRSTRIGDNTTHFPIWGWRAAPLAGDTTKARKAFQDFFELWKDADTGIPMLKQAKPEYAKLN
jgi:hypothetical protein